MTETHRLRPVSRRHPPHNGSTLTDTLRRHKMRRADSARGSGNESFCMLLVQMRRVHTGQAPMVLGVNYFATWTRGKCIRRRKMEARMRYRQRSSRRFWDAAGT